MTDPVKQRLLEDVSDSCARLENGDGENQKALAHAVAKQGRLLVAVAQQDYVTKLDLESNCIARHPPASVIRVSGPLSVLAGAIPPSAMMLLWFIGKSLGWWATVGN